MKYGFLISFLVLLISFSCKTTGNQEKSEHFEILDSIIRSMEVQLLPLEREIERLAKLSARLFEKGDSIIRHADEPKFIEDEEGLFYNPNPDKEESTVFISPMSTNRKRSIEEVYVTEPMDAMFGEVYTKFPMVSQVYYNSENQFSRVFPAYDLFNAVETNTDIKSFNFYYQGDELRNPSRGKVWLEEVYIDPVGRGWILSLIHPVYFENQLRGVLGMDITLTDLMSNFLDKSPRNLLIIDGHGTIVAGKVEAIEALSMPPLKNHAYIQTISSDSYRREDFNLFKSKSKEVRRMASKFILEKENSFSWEMGGVSYNAFCRQMNILNWYLLDLHN